MSPRIVGVRERLDRSRFDTGEIKPGESREFFVEPMREPERCPGCASDRIFRLTIGVPFPQTGCDECGGMFDSDRFRTNVGETFPIHADFINADDPGSFIATAIGMRVVGASPDDEFVALDHIALALWIDGRLMFDMVGPQLSVLRMVPSRQDFERAVAALDGYIGRVVEDVGAAVREASQGAAESALRLADVRVRAAEARLADAMSTALSPRPGYQLGRPLAIKAGHRVRAVASASTRLAKPHTVRVFVFGLNTRSV